MSEENRNVAARKKQFWIFSSLTVAVVIGLSVLVAMSQTGTGNVHTAHRHTEPIPDMTGVIGTDFNQQITSNALTEQQEQSNTLSKKVLALQEQQIKAAAASKKQQQALLQKITALQAQLQTTEISAYKRQKNSGEKNTDRTNQRTDHVSYIPQPAPIKMTGESGSMAIGNEVLPVAGQISNVQFSYSQTKTPSNPLLNRYIPSGTFVKAVILEGADANASVTGQSNTSPMLFRLTGQAFLPNDQYIDLSGCLVTASVYGDISSERGEVRLNTLSCNLKDHVTIDTKVQGHVAFAGKEGVRGRPVMRNGRIIAWAGMSGALSGIGSALQQSQTTQSISPLGVTNTVNGAKVWQSGLTGGASTALNTLSQYYIKRADQYHPIIEIGANNIVTVIFQRGFRLTPVSDDGHNKNNDVQTSQVANAAKEAVKNAGSALRPPPADTNNLQVPVNVLKMIQQSHLGETIPETTGVTTS